MKLYNTLSQKIKEFKPLDGDLVKIYTCGPTVYSNAHIGNFTAYIYWDLLVRVLRLNGWDVRRVLNITDVGHLASDADEGEDKMEKGARRMGKTVWDVARYYEEDFLTQFRALGLIEPSVIARATEFIEEDMALVDLLDEKGYVYETEDGLYFDTSKFSSYADFARLDLKGLRAGARVEFSVSKRNVSDFALWKWVREGEDHAMQWEYRGRAGYPGWHIECASIIRAKLGSAVGFGSGSVGTIDIHCGGVDHIPIHHTNEIAEYEAAYGEKLANFWLHNNFITIEGEKISKSLGNVYLFSDLVARGFSHLDYKMWVLQGHYQAERNFSFEDLAAAHARLMNYRNFAAMRWQAASDEVFAGFESSDFAEEKAAILEQLNNNLNSAGALAVLDGAVKSGKAPSLGFLEFLDEAFGLDLVGVSDIEAGVRDLITERASAKAERDFAKADELREKISEFGIEVLDGKEGVSWRLVD